MGTLLDRYRAGECVQVWEDIRALGTTLQSAPISIEALAVAAETMRRARANIVAIVAHLEDLHFRFAASSPLEALGPTTTAQVNDLDSKLGGSLPLSVKAWYIHVGAVDLRGTHPSLCHVANVGEDVPRDFKLADPLVIAPIEWLLEGFSHWSSGLWGNQTFRLELSPDDLHKANISGGTYDMPLAGPQVDAVLLDWHSFHFVDYIRCVFAWGGFPGWERYPDPPTSEIEYLTRDLLPL
jgi:hypothetical protein